MNEEKINEEKTEETNEQNTDKAPSATFLNSLVMSVRLKDGSLRHVQFSIFEEDDTSKVRVFYDVINPSDVHLK